MTFRAYDPKRDTEAVRRIWKEIGWLEEGREESFDIYLEAMKVVVADIDGTAECMVATCSGTIRYLEQDLPMCNVAAVTTSRIARKQKLAGRLTTLAIATDAADGALIAGLGMFEQGYYNRLGFGNGPYEHWVSFDPADLLVETTPRVPRRITEDEWKAVHAARLARSRGHGGCNLIPSGLTKGAMKEKNTFGLGYYDGPNGEPTHYLWIRSDKLEHGPYTVCSSAWQTGDQFLELLGLLKSLGDQVHMISMLEPQGIQLQDFLRQPLKRRFMGEKSEYSSSSKADAYWQLRILDLPGCMAQTHLQCADLRFNLRLTDPIELLLDKTSSWRGVDGDYIVTLGQESSAVRGERLSLPTLKASVGAFTRMWMGVQPPSGLAITDQLSGPPELLRDLDRAFMLPKPHLGWDI